MHLRLGKGIFLYNPYSIYFAYTNWAFTMEIMAKVRKCTKIYKDLHRHDLQVFAGLVYRIVKQGTTFLFFIENSIQFICTEIPKKNKTIYIGVVHF